MSDVLAVGRVPLDQVAARRLTDEVREDAAALWGKLLELYERGAHTALGYPSWGAYFEAEFGQHKRTGYKLLEAARVVADLPVPHGAPRPNERQARELARVPEPERAEVWQAATERAAGEARSVTAADVRESAAERLAPVVPLRREAPARPAPAPRPPDVDLTPRALPLPDDRIDRERAAYADELVEEVLALRERLAAVEPAELVARTRRADALRQALPDVLAWAAAARNYLLGMESA